MPDLDLPSLRASAREALKQSERAQPGLTSYNSRERDVSVRCIDQARFAAAVLSLADEVERLQVSVEHMALLTVQTERDEARAEIERLRGENERLPGMTAEKLRLIAGWLDTYDRLAATFLTALPVIVNDTDPGDIEAARQATEGKEVQNELRAWADLLDARAGGSDHA